MMDYQEERTPVGRALYSISMGGAAFLSRHMWLWWILNLTWGIVGSVIGVVILLFVAVFLPEKKVFGRFCGFPYIMFGDNWGGLECVFGFLVADNMGDWTAHVKAHEIGHSFQNAIFGPLAPFIVSLPSVFRYHYQQRRARKGLDNKPYDLIWFEGAATDAGEAFVANVH